MIRVEFRRKDGIRILYVVMLKRKARNRCSRGCLVRIRVVCSPREKVRMPQTQRSLGPVNVRVSPQQEHQRSSKDRQREEGLHQESHPQKARPQIDHHRRQPRRRVVSHMRDRRPTVSVPESLPEGGTQQEGHLQAHQHHRVVRRAESRRHQCW
ncbi:hypothetical protein Hanom_Chr02g00109781 [Helianthus anomalus]